MHLGHAVARNQGRGRQGLARVQRSPNDMRLVPPGELGGRIDRLGGVALRIADDQLDLPALDTAGRVDLLYGQFRPAVDADARGRAGAGQGRQIADADRLGLRNRRTEDAGRKRRGARRGSRQSFATN